MPSSPARPPAARASRPVVLLALATAGLTLALAGCSSSAADAPAAAPSAATGQRNGGQRPPGVSGLIAEVSGKTLQVQGTSEQTAVTWTGSTTFTQTTKATASALEAGLCAAVRTAGAGSATPAAPATPATGPVAAASVTLSPAVDGSCTGGFGGGYGGGRPSGAPSGPAPSGVPSGDPSGARANGPGGFAGRGTDGKVTSVDGSTFVVAAREPGGTATTSVTVTTSGSTTWTQVTSTSAKAATVGRCATATGRTSGTGALTATTVRLSAPASDGTCTQGFGGRRGGAGRPGQGATTRG